MHGIPLNSAFIYNHKNTIALRYNRTITVNENRTIKSMVHFVVHTPWADLCS